MRWFAQVCGLLLLAHPAACARGEGTANGSAHPRRTEGRGGSGGGGGRSARRVHAHGHVQYHGHQVARNTTISSLAAIHGPAEPEEDGHHNHEALQKKKKTTTAAPSAEELEQFNAKTQEEEAQLEKFEEETEDRAEEREHLAKEKAKRLEAKAKEDAFRRFRAVQGELCAAIQDVTDLPEQSNKTHCPDVEQRKKEASEAKEEVMRIKEQLKAALVQLAAAEAAVASEEILLAEVHANEVAEEAKATAKKEKKAIQKLKRTITTVTEWSSNHSEEETEIEEVSTVEEERYLGTWCFVNKDAVEKLKVERTKRLEGSIQRPGQPDVPYIICVCGHIAVQVQGKWDNGTVDGDGNLVWNHTTESEIWFRPDSSDTCSKKRAVQAIAESMPETDMREESVEQAAMLGLKSGARAPGCGLGTAWAFAALSWGAWRW